MNTVTLIKQKRDGLALSENQINFLITNYANKKIPDYQFSAFLMAGFLNGFNEKETTYLTKSMLFSGKVISLLDIPGKKIDKHSTGGVGDKTSLIIAPIAAAAGINVPMISGRGLGHSGGTLDKLESIPGFKTSLSLSSYKNVLRKCKAVLIGQTKELAPADKLIYALRDVTATVESIPLITASIMSKKLAEGIDGLVLDVKTGSGAFMKTLKDAELLANSLIRTAKSFNKEVIAFITDMNQPLGNYIGNWLEVYESIKILQGETVPDLYEVSLNLAGAMIFLGKKAGSIEEGIDISKKLLINGKAYDKFLEIVELQKGDTFFIKNPNEYPKAKIVETFHAEKTAYLQKIDNYQIGMAALELGAGRKTKDDFIDPTAGIIFYPKIGDKIMRGNIIAKLFGNDKEKVEQAKNMIIGSLKFSDTKVNEKKLIKKIIV